MSTSIRYLRLYLHRPAQANGTAGRREAIGYLSQYGDILRVSFDEAYIRNPQRPTLSLSYQGADEAATQQILASARDARLVRTDGRWPVYSLATRSGWAVVGSFNITLPAAPWRCTV